MNVLQRTAMNLFHLKYSSNSSAVIPSHKYFKSRSVGNAFCERLPKREVECFNDVIDSNDRQSINFSRT